MQHSLRDRILAKVELHASLLGRLAGNENVPILLKESQSQLDQLTKQLNDERDKLLECEKKTKQEYDQVAALKRNTTKRLLVLMANGGRKRGLDSVVEKGETGYLQAFQEEQEQKDKVMALEGATNAATTETEELKQRLGKYIDVRRQLDTIYRDLFNGSTPEFPEEDEAEQAVRTAETLYQTAKAAYKCEHEALSLLKKAEHTISICHKYMRKVERYSLHNAYNNIGIFNDIMEPDVLEKAQGSAKQVEELMKKATELMPAIKSIGKLEVVWGYNPKEPEFLEKIQECVTSVRWNAVRLAKEVHRSTARLAGTKQYLVHSAAARKAHKVELEDLRKRIILRIAAGGDGSNELRVVPQNEDLPSYTRRPSMFIPTIPRHIIEGVMQSDPAPPPLPPPPPLIDAELPPFTVAEPPALSIPTDSSNPGSPLDPDESFSPYNHPSLDSPVYTAFSRSLSDVTSPQDASTSTSTNPFHQLLIQNASPASHSSPDLAHPRPTIATAELRAASLLAYDSPLPSPGPSPGPIPSSSPCLSSDSERNSIQWPSATSAPSGPLESSGTGASGTPDQMAAVSAATSIEPAPFFFSLFPLPPSGPASHSTTPVASPSSTATV